MGEPGGPGVWQGVDWARDQDVAVVAFRVGPAGPGELRVEAAGRGWAVRRAGMALCVGRDGAWALEPMPSARTDEWLAAHRWGHLGDALAAARAALGRG